MTLFFRICTYVCTYEAKNPLFMIKHRDCYTWKMPLLTLKFFMFLVKNHISFLLKKRTFIFIKLYKYILMLKSVPILPENCSKNRLSKKAPKCNEISHLIWNLLSKRQLGDFVKILWQSWKNLELKWASVKKKGRSVQLFEAY